MISVGREKIVSISQYRREDGEDIHTYFGGLDTLRNPIMCVRGKPETMGDLKWALDELLGVKTAFQMGMVPEYIVLHHSLTKDGQVVDWQAIRRYHKGLGWVDIGYYYGVENVNGEYEILKGRMDNQTGAHAIGFNHNSLGVCVIGNFDQAPPTEEQLDPTRRLIRSLMAAYNIPASKVIGHRETYSLRKVPVIKTCPGSQFDLDAFRRSL